MFLYYNCIRRLNQHFLLDFDATKLRKNSTTFASVTRQLQSNNVSRYHFKLSRSSFVYIGNCTVEVSLCWSNVGTKMN